MASKTRAMYQQRYVRGSICSSAWRWRQAWRGESRSGEGENRRKLSTVKKRKYGAAKEGAGSGKPARRQTRAAAVTHGETSSAGRCKATQQREKQCARMLKTRLSAYGEISRGAAAESGGKWHLSLGEEGGRRVMA